jgi:enamine deaminase RidA (YjgF/YER057c/UK114 family)
MSPGDDSMDAEERLVALGLKLPPPPTPLGAYEESVRSGAMLFLSGTLPIDDGIPQFRGRIGANLSIEEGRSAARLAALNALALAKTNLKTLSRVKRVIRPGVSIVATDNFCEHPKVGDGASELLADVFGVHSLPLGLCVELELILEVGD